VIVNSNVDTNYFLYEMTDNELQAVIVEINNNYKNSWEQVRQLAYVQANCFTSKHIAKTDLMPFSWDKKETIEPPTPQEMQKALDELHEHNASKT
jgi:hypothetical protein